ncbi:hypothetical protein [Alkalinema sp. FACHB-956]|uniref:hypothetical protein n=1 Tax=Alkalinema sp. FACHB-956 TaxID=2692768 RepID=UPI001685244D|nr:hypothetical protein [Alkalinema sp. FACHB-956]MBD2330103.1 hypothetical protein [Alkalinema sp. FACHB-956]
MLKLTQPAMIDSQSASVTIPDNKLQTNRKSVAAALIAIGMTATSLTTLAVTEKPVNANSSCNAVVVSSSRNIEYRRGATLRACNGFRLVFQADGNLVVYNTAGRPLWATGTNGTGANILAVQSDGNVVLYENGNPLWASNTDRNPGSRLAMQADGNLVVYRSNGQPIFSTGTDGGQVKTLFASYDWWEARSQSAMFFSKATGRPLDGGANGGNQAYMHSQAMPWNRFQRWQFLSLGNNEFMIINNQTSRALDGGGSNGNQAYLNSQQMPLNKFQRWRLQPTNGGHMIINVATERALDSGGSNGNQIYMNSRPDGNPYQVWQISKVPALSATRSKAEEFFRWAEGTKGITRRDGDFFKKHKDPNQRWDPDGQCVTLIVRYLQDVFFNGDASQRGYGHGKDVASGVASSHSNLFEPLTRTGLPKRGAIVSFKGRSDQYYLGQPLSNFGHVGIVMEAREINGRREIKMMDSNSDAKGPGSVVKIGDWIPLDASHGGLNGWTNPR